VAGLLASFTGMLVGSLLGKSSLLAPEQCVDEYAQRFSL